MMSVKNFFDRVIILDVFKPIFDKPTLHNRVSVERCFHSPTPPKKHETSRETLIAASIVMVIFHCHSPFINIDAYLVNTGC